MSYASKSLDNEFAEENAHMEYFDVNETQRFQNGTKRPPSSGELISEPAKRMRVVNSSDLPRGRMATTVVDSSHKNIVLSDVSPLIESQYIVDDGDQVVYDGNRSSDMGGIENETVEALMQSLSPYEFSFNEMGQLMITEPIFENEEPTASAQDSNAMIGDDAVTDQQLSECNINTDDLDDIDQFVAPILENSEGKTLKSKVTIRENSKLKTFSVFIAEGFDLVAYTMKKTSDSISDTSSPIKESPRSNYSILLKNKPRIKFHDQNFNISNLMSVRRLAEIDQLVANGESVEIVNNLADDKNGTEYQNLYSDSDGTDDETADDQFDLRNDEHSLFFGPNKCFTTDVIDQNGIVPLDSGGGGGNGYGEKENSDDVEDNFRGIRNWYGCIPKPLNTNRFGMGKTRGGSALRRNILTARKSNPTHQAYNYAINNHSIKFNSSNHETTIRLDQNGSSTNTFQLLRTNGSVIRANQIIASNSASGNGVGVASVLNRTGGRRIGQIVQTQKLNRRLMTLGTAFDNVVANVTAGTQFLRPLNPKANQADDKLKIFKRGLQKPTVVPGSIRLCNILPTGTTVNGFSLDDIIGARPRNERNISNHSSGHELNGTAKKMKSSNFSKDNSTNVKTNHISSSSSSSSAGQSVLKNSVYATTAATYNAKHSSNRSNHRNAGSATNVTTTTVTIAMTPTSSLSSNGASNSFTSPVPSTQQGNVIMVNGTTMVNNSNRGRSLIKPSLYSRSVSGGSGKGSASGSGMNSNPRK